MTSELKGPKATAFASSVEKTHPWSSSLEMMLQLARRGDAHGRDAGSWCPAMDAGYGDPKTVERALKEWGAVFKKLPRIDAVFVRGGEPGHTRPAVLMDLLAKQTENLHRSHPKAQMWVSPQSFNQPWLEEFLGILRSQQPPWLAGVVYGPQVRMSLSQLRAAIPE